MQDDFTGGQKTKTIEPLNNLTQPKVPDFNMIEEMGAPAVTTETVLGTADAGEQSNTNPVSADHAKPKFLAFHWSLSKRATILCAAIAVLLIGGATTAAYLAQPRGQGSKSKSTATYTPPKVTTVASNLSGLQVDTSINQRPVIGVMIENSTDARPQSGLDQASIVFEAIAEGGITRFHALFQDNTPDYIGPVRSARPYYVQWCMSFDCALVHAGGSPEALQNIRSWGTKDIDDNTTTNWRVDSRYAPHNLYTSMPKILEYAGSRGYGAATYTTLARKKDAPSKTPNAASVDINISSALFNSHYDYDAASNSYKRNQAGAAHMVTDKAGAEKQLQPKTVVAMVMSYGVASDKHSQYGTIGSGEAYVFQDGVMTKGTWRKDDIKSALTLTNEADQPLTLNAGQTWFVALSGSDRLTYR